MIRVKKLNDIKVTPPNALVANQDKRPVKGASLFTEPYGNIFLCARKKSGKSITIFNILRQCVGRDTTVIFFCSTLYKDAVYANMMKMLDDNGINYMGYTSLKEDGIDHLNDLVQMLTKKAEDDFNKKDIPTDKLSHLLFNGEQDEIKENKPKKTKYLAPEYIIILDDLSDELKSTSLVTLLKKNRHFLAKILISSQYYLDLLPSSRKQIDVFLIFQNITEDKLLQIHKDANLTITWEQFLKIYKWATLDKYNFLYVDCINSLFRKNFNTAIELN